MKLFPKYAERKIREIAEIFSQQIDHRLFEGSK